MSGLYYRAKEAREREAARVARAAEVTTYEASGWSAYVAEDNFADGCDTESSYKSGSESWSASTPEALLDELAGWLGQNRTNAQTMEDEPGRVNFSRLETDDADAPSPAQLAAWKRGDFRLWLVDYTFTVQRVTRALVDLTEILESA